MGAWKTASSTYNTQDEGILMIKKEEEEKKGNQDGRGAEKKQHSGKTKLTEAPGSDLSSPRGECIPIEGVFGTSVSHMSPHFVLI